MSNRTKVKVRVGTTSASLHDRVVMLGDATIKRLKIPVQQPLTLQYGSLTQEVKVVSISNSSSIRMNDTLAHRLSLDHDAQLCLQYRAGTRTLSIGPLIGVLMSRVTSALDRPFGAQTAFCKELTQACAEHGAFVYFFTPDEVKTTAQTIRGWNYKGGWRKGEYPVPNVVYNRLTTRKLENLPSVQNFMKDVKQRYGTGIFNEKYLNKNEVFDALKGNAAIDLYLPESHLLKNFQTLKDMLSKHSSVFIKPVTGSLGKGIIKITRSSAGFISHTTYSGGVGRTSFNNLSTLFNKFSGKWKAQNYQIQQGLNLISVNGRPVDFRALVQRNEKGQWELTSIVGRIAGDQHFVSNLARGGSLSSVGSAIARSNLAASLKATRAARLKKAALDIASGIEKGIDAHFAELGVDLAVDINGKVWLLEVNSKPSKDDNTQLDTGKVRPSTTRIVRYARYMAKF